MKMDTKTDTLLLVETDEGVERKLDGVLTARGLNSQYTVKRIGPDRALDVVSEMINDAVARTSAVIDSDRVALVLVDVAVGDKGDDRHGFQIAKLLRHRYPDIPLYLTSNWLDGVRGDNLVSEASFEDVDGFVTKGYAIENVNTDVLRKLIRRPRLQRHSRPMTPGAVASEPAARLSAAASAVRQRFGASAAEPRVTLVARTFGEDNFWSLIGKAAENAHGTIDVMQPGRSGAAVLKLYISFQQEGKSRTHLRPYVFKISNDEATITAEIANSHEAAIRLPKAAYARMVSSTAHVQGGIAAALMELEEDAISFRQWWSRNPPSLPRIKTIARRLSERLDKLYGWRERDRVLVWKQYFRIDDENTVYLLAALDDIESFKGHPVSKRDLDRVRSFVQTHGESEARIMNLQISSELRFAHNDLNSGNVLITDDDQVTLIDFARAGKSSAFHDLAKFQRDLLYRVMDSGTMAFADWNRFPVWRIATQAASDDVDSKTLPDDREIRRIVAFCTAFRESFWGCCVSDGDRHEYDCALLHYVLKAVALPDISVQKRLAATEHAAKLLARLSS